MEATLGFSDAGILHRKGRLSASVEISVLLQGFRGLIGLDFACIVTFIIVSLSRNRIEYDDYDAHGEGTVPTNFASCQSLLVPSNVVYFIKYWFDGPLGLPLYRLHPFIRDCFQVFRRYVKVSD